MTDGRATEADPATGPARPDAAGRDHAGGPTTAGPGGPTTAGSGGPATAGPAGAVHGPAAGARPASSPERPLSAFASVAMVVSGAVSVQVGGALAVWLMPRGGPAGIVALRLVAAALIMLAVCRPRLRGYAAGDWRTVIVFGVVIGAMNNLFYQAVARIPLGIGVTLEVLGPLTLSVIVSRRLINLLWAALAFTGVSLLGGGGFGGLDTLGVAYGVGAGAMWAMYIILSVRTGRRFPQADGLALAMAVGAVLSLPLGIVAAGQRLLVPSTIGLTAAVAVLSSVLPYSLEMLALRQLPAATVAVLLSLEPAIAALAGYLVLHQALSVIDALAIALVIAASMGAVGTRSGRLRPPRRHAARGGRDT